MSFGTIVLALVGVTASSGCAFRFYWRKPSRLRSRMMNTLLVFGSISWSLLLVESFFRFFVVQSDALNVTIAGRRWMERHWKPINRSGYRDIEQSAQKLRGGKVLFVVGDSFAAGHGIEDCQDRFSDLLGARLAPEWSVVNMGKNGWQTPAQYRAIQRAAVKPDEIVLSYFVNDILDAAARHGRPAPTFAARPRPGLAWTVDHSHVANFVYWRWYRSRLTGMRRDHIEYFRQVYGDPTIWAAHAEELRQITEYAQLHGIGLTVVIFPHLRNVSGTRSITAKVAEVFRADGVRVIDLGQVLTERDPEALVVNSVDPHPGVALHREVAGLIYEEVFGRKMRRQGRSGGGAKPQAAQAVSRERR